MNLARPKYSSPILILMGFLAFAFPVIAVCSTLCPTDSPGGTFLQHANCGTTTHSFVSIGAGLSALFTLLLMGKFVANIMLFIPAGHLFPIFKPPRFSSYIFFDINCSE
ncbi:hypothetical protein D1BOALGB6SA_4266 [Olavius sp. associated proteobacterium Delta 1]|nr:hypothetical protein D1BOALGB6SA_4266 [Olavius sp. associated proteobacterium Delta 1]